jgi:crotonobetainyl-CoA:carnitine CoA-transferase CaiB-like acyl-CoA transferase
VSIEQAVAAPFATRQLADLGARVVKIERPDGGDFARHYDGAVKGLGAHWVWLNRSKESLAVDLKAAAGRAIVLDLLNRADVFVQNLAPGAASRLGFDAATLRQAHPGLVAVDVSGYGDGGPYRARKAYDLLVQAEAGLVSVTGTGDHPAKTGIPTADLAAGMYAFSGVLAALLRKSRSGEGATVEVSMLEAVAEWMGHPLYATLYTGTPPARSGLAHPAIVPYDGYPAADGQVLIGVQNDRQWRSLARELLGDPGLADDPDFATNVARCRHRERVDAIVAAATSPVPAAVLVARLDAAGVPCGRLNPVGGLIDHPQLEARDRWREVATAAGPVRALLPPLTFEGQARMGAVPVLGEHTDRLLREIGRNQGEIDALHAAGIVGRPPEPD